MSTQLAQIAKKAKCDPKARFTSLAHLLTPQFLQATWKELNRRGASGIDGESIEHFERELEERSRAIVTRLKAGTYRAPPVRRVDIPKGPGKVGTRPLGIPTVEDRLVQRAVAKLLEAVFEADFCDASYGYRRGRSPHQALQAVRTHVLAKKVAYVYEDVRDNRLQADFSLTDPRQAFSGTRISGHLPNFADARAYWYAWGQSGGPDLTLSGEVSRVSDAYQDWVLKA